MGRYENPFVDCPASNEDLKYTSWVKIPIFRFHGQDIPRSIIQAIVFVVEHFEFWGTLEKARDRLAAGLRLRFPETYWARKITGRDIEGFYDNISDDLKHSKRLPANVKVVSWHWRYENAFEDLDRAAARKEMAEEREAARLTKKLSEDGYNLLGQWTGLKGANSSGYQGGDGGEKAERGSGEEGVDGGEGIM